MSETKETGGQAPVPDDQSKKPDDPMIYPLGTVGAVIGAALGVGVMYIGLKSGFYAEVAIGMLAGWIAALMARRASWGVGVIAGVVTLVAGVWAEWKLVGPFVADDSFWYFVRHFLELKPFKLLSHAIGVGAAVWFGAKR
jgi:hypothetical protein